MELADKTQVNTLRYVQHVNICVVSCVTTHTHTHAQDFNIVVAPCVSPWGYERIERWTANAGLTHAHRARVTHAHRARVTHTHTGLG